MKKQLYIWIVLCFVITFSSCDKEEEEKKTTPSETPLLELNTTNKDIDVDKDSFVVVVTANHNWEIKELPNWVSAHPASGTGTDSVIFNIGENNTTTDRTANIIFSGTDLNRTLNIHQLSEINNVQLPLLGIANFSSFKAEYPTKYSIEHSNLFINSTIAKNIYLGRLISNKASSPEEIKGLNYTFDRITISTDAAISEPILKTYAPSLNEQKVFAQSVIDRMPKQILSFNAETSRAFYSLNQLYAIGMVNLGIKLDEIVTGESYKTATMRKNFGVVYGFRTALFNLIMDLPDKPFDKEIEPEILAEGVSYITAIDYGRVGLLVAESDYRPKYVKAVVNKIIRNQSLTHDDLQVINASEFTHIHFDNDNELQTDRGKQEVIEAYKNKVTNMKESNWYPISFQAANIQDLSQTFFSFTYKL